MARGQIIKFLRTTQSALNTQATNNNLIVGEPYLITDINMLAIATANNVYKIIGTSTPVINTSLTSLTINCALATIFRIPIATNSNFIISNMPANGEVEFRVKNTSTTAITVSMPNGQVYANQSVDISAGKARIFYLSYYGSVYEWLVSGELSNV